MTIALPKQPRASTVFIILCNLAPFYGLMTGSWDIFSIFFLYWAENAIIGIYTLVMMGFHQAARGVFAFIGSLFMMAFFVFHYGMFCMAHVAILTEIFGKDMLLHKNFQPEDLVPLLLSPKIRGFYMALAGLAIAQAFHCFKVYAVYFSKIKDPQIIMFSPYGRIVVLHVGILVGGFLAQSIGQPVWALAVLVGLKTLYDIGADGFWDDEEKLKKMIEDSGKPSWSWKYEEKK